MNNKINVYRGMYIRCVIANVLNLDLLNWHNLIRDDKIAKRDDRLKAVYSNNCLLT